MTNIRHATKTDIPAITEIFNEAILKTTASFYLEPRTVEDRLAWFNSHSKRFPILVAEVEEEVAGWASLTQWSERPAYDGTAETSFYVKESHRGLGIGTQLKQETIAEAKRLGFHTLLARMADGSDASIHVNQKFGFEFKGTMKEVGFKFGRYIDVHLYQLMLE
jgi:phosphinothricin acetyltransferase